MCRRDTDGIVGFMPVPEVPSRLLRKPPLRCTRRCPPKPTTAMILAAGLGLRMRPLTDKMPKPLVSVAGKPLLDHVLDRLADAGVNKAVVNVHYLPDQIVQHVAQAQPSRR